MLCLIQVPVWPACFICASWFLTCPSTLSMPFHRLPSRPRFLAFRPSLIGDTDPPRPPEGPGFCPPRSWNIRDDSHLRFYSLAVLYPVDE
ncbi:hypothetical protein QBC39DRAFT_360132 [Podospora conica]|nr:hypothetical protein QBC39DRAFT_360132 [Schizothecium conicum]